MCPARGIALFLAMGCAAGVASAQPPGRPKVPGRIELEPRSANQAEGPQSEEYIEDIRRWLEGGNPHPKASDIDPKKFQELMKKLNQNKDVDPKQLQQILKEHPDLQNKDFLKQFEKMLDDPEFMKSLEGKLRKNEGPPIDDKQTIDEKLKEVIKSGKEQGDPKLDPTTGEPPKLDPNSANDPNAATGKEPGPEEEWAKWLEKNFADSPGTQDAIKDLVAALKHDNGKGLFDDVPELKNGGWKDLENWGKANAGDNWNLKPPDLKMGSSAKIGGSSGGSPFGSGGGSSSGPSFGGGGSGLGGGGLTSLAIIAGIVGAIILAIILLRKWKVTRAERLAQASFGNGGIDFDAVRTREELVRVFETVSLEQHGEDARNWNHRVIAEQFHSQPTKAQPADEAADLYERARYAPADEELSSSEFADARRDLRVIAGVPA